MYPSIQCMCVCFYEAVQWITNKWLLISEQETCLLPALVGDCHNYSARWYYDSFEARCKQFYYGGCSGNGNNFQNEDECQRYCDKNYIAPTEPTIQFSTGKLYNNKKILLILFWLDIRAIWYSKYHLNYYKSVQLFVFQITANMTLLSQTWWKLSKWTIENKLPILLVLYRHA